MINQLTTEVNQSKLSAVTIRVPDSNNRSRMKRIFLVHNVCFRLENFNNQIDSSS